MQVENKTDTLTKLTAANRELQSQCSSLTDKYGSDERRYSENAKKQKTEADAQIGQLRNENEQLRAALSTVLSVSSAVQKNSG